MPELPEVETMRRGLLPIVGGRIRRVEFPEIPYRPIAMTPEAGLFCDLSEGQRIVAVERVAKRVLVRLENRLAVVVQPKMAGMVLLTEPPSWQHVRMVVHLQGGNCPSFLYWDRRGLGTVHLWDPDQCQAHLGPSVLGPDALQISSDEFRQRLGGSRRPIKPALLDQRLVAGVGNLYASEILHAARVHPERTCAELSAVSWRNIHTAMQAILREAIEYEGSSLGDGTYRSAINGEGRFQNLHRVYARDGQPCMTCDRGPVVRIVQAQRSTFFCPRCQRPSSPKRKG